METFNRNEGENLAVFKDFERLESRVSLRSFSQGIVLWEENIAILNRVNAVEDKAPCSAPHSSGQWHSTLRLFRQLSRKNIEVFSIDASVVSKVVLFYKLLHAVTQL